MGIGFCLSGDGNRVSSLRRKAEGITALLRSSVFRGSEAPPEPHSLPLPFDSRVICPHQQKKRHTAVFLLEQATGIEPARSAWEAEVLPLNYACAMISISLCEANVNSGFCGFAYCFVIFFRRWHQALPPSLPCRMWNIGHAVYLRGGYAFRRARP